MVQLQLSFATMQPCARQRQQRNGMIQRDTGHLTHYSFRAALSD